MTVVLKNVKISEVQIADVQRQGFVSGVALEFRLPVTAAPLFAKVKYLDPMFGDVGQARTNAAMLLPMIATTSSRTCTKPTVVRSFVGLLI